jgi:hypothetical protein
MHACPLMPSQHEQGVLYFTLLYWLDYNLVQLVEALRYKSEGRSRFRLPMDSLT